MWRAMRCPAAMLLVFVAATILPQTTGFAAPQRMTDAELDEVSAAGFSIDVNTGDPSTFKFSFDLGPNFGDGSVVTSPGTLNPSTNVFQGPVDLTNARINVENMIFNLNICVQCQGTILQSGIGIPISVKTTP